MVRKFGVNVRVANVEFVNPNLLNYYQEHQHKGIQYIKVATGEQFIVVIDVTPDFDFMGHQDVEVRCSIDSEEDVAWFLFAAETATLPAQNSMRRINFFDTERVVDNQWMSCALSFGELKIDDNIDQTPHGALVQSGKLGRIDVTITRGTAAAWGPEEMFPHECATDIELASRAVVEKHHVTHTLKTLPLSERNAPVSHWRFEPAAGLPGFPLHFHICYRSQEALELLRVIPQSNAVVGNGQQDRQDRATRSQRAPIRPNLDAEADVIVEGGPSTGTRSKVRARDANTA